MQLTGLTINDLGPFVGEHRLDIKPGLNVLVGPNNGGKTTLLRGLTGHIGDVRRLPGGTRSLNFKPTNTQLSGVRSLGISSTDAELTFGSLRTTLVSESTERTELTHNGHNSWTRRRGATTQSGISMEPLDRLLESASGFGIGFWSPVEGVFASAQMQNLLHGCSEDAARHALTYLRMMHPEYFEVLNELIRETLGPAITGLGFHPTKLDTVAGNPEYEPRFKIAGSDDQIELSRVAVGAGAWTYTCLMLSVIGAIAEGCRAVVLDEPHVYLHPSVERKLCRQLCSKRVWRTTDPVVVVATHSPEFVDYAQRTGSVSALVLSTDASARIVSALDTTPAILSDVLYSEQLLYCEGPSDANLLATLVMARTTARARAVPLGQADSFLGKGSKKLDILTNVWRVRDEWRLTAPVLVLDEDKRKQATPPPNHLPRIVFVGLQNNDFESVFANFEFLTGFFAARNIKKDDVVADAVSKVSDSGDAANKGGNVLWDLLAALLGEDCPESKDEVGVMFLRHLLDNWDDPNCAEPRKHVEKLCTDLKLEPLEGSGT